MPRKTKKKPRPSPNFILVDVDNPNYQPGNDGEPGNPKKEKAFYNYRESPVAFMYARRYISKPQAEAGVKFRLLYEKCGGGGARAIDWRKEPVDGGGWKDPFTDKSMEAARELIEVRNKLGREGYMLVEMVCGNCVFLNDIAKAEGYSKRYVSKLSRNLQECLDVLAVYWGFQRLKTRSYRKTG